MKYLNGVLGGLGCLVAVLCFGVQKAESAQLYDFTGKIMNIDANSVTIQHGKQQFEFNRSDLKLDPSVLKKGHEITVFYNLDVKRATPAQAAGIAAPGMAPPSDHPDTPLKQHLIQDDRVFENAQNPAQQPGVSGSQSSG